MKNRSLIAYITLTFLISIIFILLGNVTDNIILLTLEQATPFFAILIISLVFFEEKIYKNLGLNKLGKFRWYILALLLPTLAISLSYLIGWFLGFLNLHSEPESFQVGFFIYLLKSLFKGDFLYSITAFPIVLIWAFGEEIGWRGYLQPKLIERFGVKKGILFTGLIWSLWHYPAIFLMDYYKVGNPLINITLFTITVTLMAISIGYLTYKSKSVWPAVLFHTKSNLSWQLCSMSFIPATKNSVYLSGEAGIINILFWGILAVFVFRRLSSKEAKL